MSLLRALLFSACGSALLAEEDCAWPPAHCVLPRAASVVPASRTDSSDECPPRAKCVTPSASTIRELPRSSSTNPSVKDFLRTWENASASHTAWTAREREWLRRRAGETLSAHAFELVLRLTEPVMAKSLEQDFEWSIASTTESVTTVTAIPRDDATRLFCRALQIDLDHARGVPVAIRMTGRNGQQPVLIERELVVPASFSDSAEVPPSPTATASTSVIRFAAGESEVPR